MKSKSAAMIPDSVSEEDAMRMYVFDLEAVALKSEMEKLQMKLEILQSKRAPFEDGISKKYKITPGKDSVDLSTRKITRG